MEVLCEKVNRFCSQFCFAALFGRSRVDRAEGAEIDAPSNLRQPLFLTPKSI